MIYVQGVCIPLILTFQDDQKVKDGYFHQPLLQTCIIFLGEISCVLFIHLITKESSFLNQSLLDAVHPQHSYGNDWVVPRTSSSWFTLWFVLPSACDLVATTLLNLGLIYTTPSIYQMVKGSIVGFSAIFSFLFLSRRFLHREWFAIFSILLGTIVIVWSILNEKSYQGPVLLILAQLLLATQFVLEEYLMDRYRLDPIKSMSIESVFSALLLTGGVVICGFFGQDKLDVIKGLKDLFEDSVLWQTSLLLLFMVAAFNFFGLAVSTIVGIPGRSVIDSLRTMITWMIAIYYGWDSFSWLELVGFVILVLGVFIFNGVFRKFKSSLTEGTPLLS